MAETLVVRAAESVDSDHILQLVQQHFFFWVYAMIEANDQMIVELEGRIDVRSTNNTDHRC